jgi:hypothetical protein
MRAAAAERAEIEAVSRPRFNTRPRAFKLTSEGRRSRGTPLRNVRCRTHQRAFGVDEQEMLSYQCQSRTGGAALDLRLELVSVPVADIDRAKAFYVDQVGFCVEQDVQADENHRFVELMPPGSPCSIALTTGYIDS